MVREVESLNRLQMFLSPFQEVLAVPVQVIVEVLQQARLQTTTLRQPGILRLMHQVVPVQHSLAITLSPDLLSPAVPMTVPAAPVQARHAASPVVLRHVLPTVQVTTQMPIRVVV